MIDDAELLRATAANGKEAEELSSHSATSAQIEVRQ